MTEIEELETRIRNLPKEDFLKFRDWFYQLEDELWDQQIKLDFKDGKFDKLIEKARTEFAPFLTSIETYKGTMVCACGATLPRYRY